MREAFHVGSAGRYLFLLSHMRSYSSLLAHVLGSNEEIDGYGEMHLRYRSRIDLLRLRWRVRRSVGAPLHGRWLLDKMLHNKIRAPWRLLPPERWRTIIFLRRPAATLRSLVASMPDAGRQHAAHSQLCCDYYVARLHRLRSDGESLGARALYLDADALTRRTETTLAFLGNWLALQAPLQASYRLFPHTGESGIGDPTGSILTGRIKPETEQRNQRQAVDASALFEAQAAWQRCRQTLLRCCETHPQLLCEDDGMDARALPVLARAACS